MSHFGTWLALFLMIVMLAPVGAQRPIGPRPAPGRPTPPRGSAGGSTATGRGRALGTRLIGKKRKDPKGRTPRPVTPTPPSEGGDLDKDERAPKKLSDAERRKVGKELVLAYRRDAARIRNQTIVADLMVLDLKKGKAEDFRLTLWMKRDGAAVWHRLRLQDKSGSLRQEVLLRELPGRSLQSWVRKGEKWMRAGLDFGFGIGGVPVPLEDLLPLEFGRYVWRYEGEGRRMGRLVHRFLARPKGAATRASRLQIAFRDADRLPSLREEGKGGRLRRLKASRATTRDGIIAFERLSFEYPKLNQSAVLRIRKRLHNRGVPAPLLDPEK